MVNLSKRDVAIRVIGLFLALVLSVSGIVAEDAVETQAKPANEQAQETDDLAEILAGHSYHGEVFNEGPRQKAYLMGGTGHVDFPVTTNNEEAQKFIDQGLGQLYGFWNFEAERSFRQAASLDPDCAMAYWGAAMANLGNQERSKGFITEANKRKEHASKREVMYIDAIKAYITADKDKKEKRNNAYTKSLENLILEFPDDREAKALLALHLYKSKNSSTSYFAVDSLLQDVFDAEPMHSAHHFRIHLWDHRHPEKAIPSAALCGQTSPSIAHMWHMPGHIFSRLKRYHDAAWQQEASARVDHAHMMRDRVMPDQIENFAHNNEWFIRNLIHVGRVHDAVDLAKNMTELPRHPSYNSFAKKGSSNYGRQRLFQVLRTYELWDDIIALAQTPYLEPTDDEDEQIQRLLHLGMAYFQTRDSIQGQAQIAAVQSRLDTKLQEQKDAVHAAEEKAKTIDVEEQATKAPDDEKAKPEESDEKSDTEDAVTKARNKFTSEIKDLKSTLNALKGYEAVSQGEYQNGYKLLKKADDVDPLYLAKVQWLSSDKDEKDKAEKSIRDEVESNVNEVHPLAILVDILWQSGKKDEAREVFEKLRSLSTSIDLDVPVFTRLTPIAEELGYAADWRVAATPAADIGKRPPLDSLGPFRWRPSPSHDWELKDADGKLRSSAEFKGKSHIVIFYLGSGCLHCAKQLQAFAPKVSNFEAAGFSMVAISTDGQKGLKVSIDNYNKKGMPIPLVANPELDVFKAFRVFDDFEDQPLHGTFIINGDGMVLWQDISYEPFMDAEFVLKEATRLLANTTDGETKETITTADKPAATFHASGHTTDTLKTVQQRLVENSAVLIDVREQEEWDAGHLETAVLVPLSKLKNEAANQGFVEQLAQTLAQGKIIYCHCRSGARVLAASPILQKMGYDVRPLKAGYAELLRAGFP